MRFFLTILTLLCLGCVSTSYAQSYSFKHFNVEDGLHQSQVSTICQDKDGKLYIGSQVGGISVFDGHNFVPFFPEVLGSAIIWKIIKDHKNRLWIGCDIGLFVLDNGTLKQFSDKDGFPSVDVWFIYESTIGEIWIGTANDGLYVYDDVFYHFDESESLSFSDVNAIGEDKDGNIWVGTYENGIAIISDRVAKNVSLSSQLGAKTVYDIKLLSDGKLVCATNNGIKELNSGVFINSSINPKQSSKTIFSIEQNNKDIWLATEDEGVYIVNSDGETKHITGKSGLNSDHVITLFKDNQNNIWLGTDGGGVSLFNGRLFTYLNKRSGLSSDLVVALEEDSIGNMWIGTDNGIDVFNNGAIINHYSLEGIKAGGYVNTLLLDSKNRMWIGTEYGLCFVQEGAFVSIPFADVSDNIYTLFENDNGEILIGSDQGLSVYNGTVIKPCPYNSWQSPLLYIFQDSKNRMWYLHEDTIIILDDNTPIPFGVDMSIRNAFDISEDPNGNFYISHQYGISVFRPDGSFSQLSAENGLDNNNIYFTKYTDGFLWVGHQKGVDKVSVNKHGFPTAIRHYGKADGFVGLETNDKAFIKCSDGSYWFGTVMGAFQLNLNYEVLNKSAPLIVLTDLKLHYGSISWKKEYSGLSVQDNLPVNPVFDHKHSHISFDYIAIDYKNPKGVLYQFMLEGYDKDWSPKTTATSASYPYLPPGKYTFKVKAGNAQGVWSSTKSYTFEIKGPFWTKTWFYALIIPVVLLLIYLLMIFRTRRLSRTKRRLEEIVRRRTAELSENNKNLAQLSLVAQEIYDAVLICSPDGSIEWYNKSFYLMAGFPTREDFLKSDYGKTSHLQDISSKNDISNIISSFKTNDKAHKYDSYHLNSEGNKKWTSGTLTPIYDKKRVLINIIGIYTDITKRKAFEDELRDKNEALEQLSMVAKRMNEAVLITDAFGTIEYFNYGLVRNSGYTEEEFDHIIAENKTLQSLSSNPNIEDLINGFNTSSETVFYDAQHAKKDGDIMSTSVSLAPVYVDGGLKNIVVVYSDITARREMSDKLKQTNKDITDSIVYAKQIQRAVLPSIDILHKAYPSAFVLYEPRDIVSGDFYWFSLIKGMLVFAAADCTGHGVPGAFMSMIGNEFLHQIVNNSNIGAPHQALETLDKMIVRALHQNDDDDNSTKDGMDIALGAIRLDSKFCQFSGAFNPLYLIRNGELIIYEPVKESIGGGLVHTTPFKTHEFQLQTGDRIYVFSDGYTDQFGGPRNKKFTRKRFQNLLLDIQNLPMTEQQKHLKKTYLDWRGDLKQIDDILVIGIEID